MCTERFDIWRDIPIMLWKLYWQTYQNYCRKLEIGVLTLVLKDIFVLWGYRRQWILFPSVYLLHFKKRANIQCSKKRMASVYAICTCNPHGWSSGEMPLLSLLSLLFIEEKEHVHYRKLLNLFSGYHMQFLGFFFLNLHLLVDWKKVSEPLQWLSYAISAFFPLHLLVEQEVYELPMVFKSEVEFPPSLSKGQWVK